VKLLRRRQPEPEPVDTTKQWEDILSSHRTWVPRSVRLDRYHAEQRQRQRERAAATPTPTKGTSQSRSTETPVAAPPQTRPKTVSAPPAPFSQPVPSPGPAEGPAAKTSDEWAYEHFLAFEKLCGNADRIAERLEEARSYEPEDTLPDYFW
jgi:hypothetical protein